MLGKFAAVIGPFLMGSVTIMTGSGRLGILSILVLFLIGGLLLMRVDFQKGEELARIIGPIDFIDNKFMKWLSDYD